MNLSLFSISFFNTYTKLDCVEQERARYEQMQKDLSKNLEECRNAAGSSANHVSQIKEEETNERPVGEESIVTKTK